MLPGTFLGYSRATNGYLLANSEGRFATSRALQRCPPREQWKPEALQRVTCTPGSTHARPQPEVAFQEPRAAEAPAVPPAPVPRRFRITQDDLLAHGYTEGCPRCRDLQQHGKAPPGLAHNEACRTRIESALRETPAGKARLEARAERINQRLADHIAHGDVQPAQSSRPAAGAAAAPLHDPDFWQDMFAGPPEIASKPGSATDMVPLPEESDMSAHSEGSLFGSPGPLEQDEPLDPHGAMQDQPEIGRAHV